MDDENAVAVVGVACRFPGADDIDEFWENLKDGKCFIDEIPGERWDVNQADVKDADASWKQRAIHAALISDYDKWDNKFFGISDSEAEWMNPQHCLALEVTYSAFENAGFPIEMLKGSKTAVYMGAMNDDLMLGLPSARHEYNNFVVTGMAPSITSNRISYFFDLRGPSMTLDTACSSALVSVHLGCQSIRTGESEMAVCGGVNSILSPLNFIPLSKAKMISPTGKSHAFSKDADGYVRGEGCGVVILKKLAKAKEDGDHIWAVIATGCNQDGHTNTPITAPSGTQQQKLLTEVYTKYGIDPGLIQYIEAHGTGTPVGDPIEVKALATFFSKYTKKGHTIPVGSVKTNIGHLESSAGTAGLIKTVLMMHHGKVIPSLHFHKSMANPAIEFDKIVLRVATSFTDWKSDEDGRRLACVNSFGFGGTNCHAVLLQQKTKNPLLDDINSFNLIVLSGKSIAALRNILSHLLHQIESSSICLKYISYTSLNRRTHYNYRLSLVARSVEDLKNVGNVKSSSINNLKPIGTENIRLIFLFCGVGTVWQGMCQEMLKGSKPFQNKFTEISQELELYTGFSLSEITNDPPDTLASDPHIGPLLIFATQVALFDVWSSFGVKPDIIIGQSVGEVAAAHAAGCLSLKNAVKLIYHRSDISAKYSGGTMLVVGKCDVNDIKQLCKQYKNAICIAVYSSNSACVVSGDKNAVDELKTNILKTKPGILLKELNVGCAYHSHHMDKACTEIEERIATITGSKPNIPIISTVTGQEIRYEEMGKPVYWTRNLRNPVLLKDAVLTALPDHGRSLIVEIGPKPVAKAHLKNITDSDVVSIPSMNSPNEIPVFLQAVGLLYEAGVPVELRNLFSQQYEPVNIPRYKFNREGSLIGANSLKAGLRLEFDNNTAHPFLSPIPLTKEFRVTLNHDNAFYIYEHQVQGRLIAPGAIYGELGLALAKEVKNIPLHNITLSIEFVRPLTVIKEQPIELKVQLSGENAFAVKRKTEVVCKGSILEGKPIASKNVNIEEIATRCSTVIQKSEFYELLRSLGFVYGKTLSIVGNCRASEREFIAEIEVLETVFNVYSLHPVVLDGALQTLALAYFTSRLSEKPEKPIPVRIGELRVHRQIEKNMIVIGQLREINKTGATIDLFICNTHGDVYVEIMKFEVRDTTNQAQEKDIRDTLYVTKWKPMDMLPQKPACQHDSTVIVTFSTEVKLFIEDALNAKHVVALPYDFDRVTPAELVAVFVKYIDSKFGSYKDISEILFYTGLSFNLQNTKSEELFVASKTSCVVLMHILQHLAQKNTFNIPFYVLTKQTQVKTANFNGTECYNVLGSELWGMTRCIMRERMFSKMHLIDIEKDADFKTVSEIMDHTRHGELDDIAEYRIEDSRVYYNQMFKFHPDEPSIKLCSYTDSEILELRKSIYDKASQPWLVPKENFTVHQDTLRMKVITGLSTSNWILPSMTDDVLAKDFWESNSKMLFLETLGLVKCDTDERHKSSHCFSFSKAGSQTFPDTKEYITCFPVVAANVVDVPRSCIVPKSLFPSYTPGNLLEILMLFLIVSELDDNVPVGIYHDADLKVNIELLDGILTFFKKKLIIACLINDLDNMQINGSYQVIVCAKHTNCIDKVLSTLSNTPCRVVVYSCNDRAENKIIFQRYQNLSLKLLNGDDIFCKETVAGIMKKIVTWAMDKKHQNILKRLPSNTETETNRCFTFQEGWNYTRVTNASSLQVQCVEKHLFRRHASYVIVGGLTGLGWEIALTIAKLGGGIILLLGRSKPTDIKQTEINAVGNKYECIMEYFYADVSDFGSISNTFDKITSKFPNNPIKGVFNGAAVVNDALLPSMTEDKFDKVLRPKILGTWNLHLVTKNLKLDYFVLHSSITSVFGNAGQTNYGAGNSFKDATALYRRSLGLPGQTINWGALRLGLVNENVERHLAEQGFVASGKDLIIKCFLRSLLLDTVQVICAEVDWQKAMRVSTDMPQLFLKFEPVLVELNLLETMRQQANDNISIPIIGTEELRLQSANERRVCILDIVTRISAETCAVELSFMKSSTTLSSVGVDSMKAMAFINSVLKHISCSIPVIAVLEEDATPASITDIIMDQLNVEHGLEFKEPDLKDKDIFKTTPNVAAVYEPANGSRCDIKLCWQNGSGPPYIHWFNDSLDMKINVGEILGINKEHIDGQIVITLRQSGNGKEHVFRTDEVEKMETVLRKIDRTLAEAKVASTDL